MKNFLVIAVNLGVVAFALAALGTFSKLLCLASASVLRAMLFQTIR